MSSELEMKKLREAEKVKQKDIEKSWKTSDWKNEDLPEEYDKICTDKHMRGALTTKNMKNYRSCLDSLMTKKKPAKEDPKTKKLRELTKGRPTFDI